MASIFRNTSPHQLLIGLSFLLLPMGLSGCSEEEFPKCKVPSKDMIQWCRNLDQRISAYHWDMEPCNPHDWTVGGASVKGRPLVYREFGDPDGQNVTLVLSMVHPDEVTPLYIGWKLSFWLEKHIRDFADTKVILAPMLNPDGCFRRHPIRMNANGVDLNRNFPTQDWDRDAIRKWKSRYRSAPRRYPGTKGGSEPETRFQEKLLEMFKPNKVLTIHAPLNFMDYDGPDVITLPKFANSETRQCLKLKRCVNAVSGGFYPGSLGNFAGQERGIPTLTLELPTASAGKAETYWKKFISGIQTVITFKVSHNQLHKPESAE